MADLQLTESYANTIGKYGSEDREDLGKGVLAAHGVSQEELDSTLAWYGKNIDDYTELYEKVDKKLISQRAKHMKENNYSLDINSGDMLWPYQTHGVLSPLGNSDGWILSINSPELERGDVLEWSMRTTESQQFNGVLGVEYTDGTSEAKSQTFSVKNKYVITLQTDTAKIVSRIYGTIRLKEKISNAIYADSIMLRKIPFDSIEFSRNRSARRYGIPVKIRPKIAKKDTIKNDTVNVDTLSTKLLNMRIDSNNVPLRTDKPVLRTINPTTGEKSWKEVETDNSIKDTKPIKNKK